VPDVTVVIATRNRRDQVLRHLPRHRAPVIVVDNASDDGTAAAVRAARYPGTTVVALERNLGAAARTVGVRAASTPYVAFADDDSYWVGDALDQVAALFAAYPRAGLITGRVLVGPQPREDPISTQMATAPLGVAPDLPGPSVLGFLACAAAVRRDAYLAVGGFEPRLRVYGEEALLAMDLATAGWGLAFVPSVTVRHLPAGDGRDPAGRRRRQVRNDLLTTWLRRPVEVGLAAARRAAATPDGRAGLRAALVALPWVLRRRRPLPPGIEAQLEVLARHPVDAVDEVTVG
jgi:N-acetylglucosaminyl-diphospho-decaprenol L-rhamnosyltransferase